MTTKLKSQAPQPSSTGPKVVPAKIVRTLANSIFQNLREEGFEIASGRKRVRDAGEATAIYVHIKADGSGRVEDDGRGIPVDKSQFVAAHHAL